MLVQTPDGSFPYTNSHRLFSSSTQESPSMNKSIGLYFYIYVFLVVCQCPAVVYYTKKRSWQWCEMSKKIEKQGTKGVDLCDESMKLASWPRRELFNAGAFSWDLTEGRRHRCTKSWIKVCLQAYISVF